MSTSDEPIDPFEAHFHRDPLPQAGIRVVVLCQDDHDRSAAVAGALESLISARGRGVESVIVPVAGRGTGRALEQALEGAGLPLVLVTTTEEPWTAGHLDPLLESIDRCDHVLGRRQVSLSQRLARWLGRLPWKLLFAVPVADIHSPCRLHRLEKLAMIPLQSITGFLDVEILAKATFFGHLIDEVKVPPLAGPALPSPWYDFVTLFRRPVLKRPSSPPEEPQRQVEAGDRPDREDRQGRGHVDPARPLEDHPAQGIDELSERQGLNQGLDRGREPLGGEEDP